MNVLFNYGLCHFEKFIISNLGFLCNSCMQLIIFATSRSFRSNLSFKEPIDRVVSLIIN